MRRPAPALLRAGASTLLLLLASCTSSPQPEPTSTTTRPDLELPTTTTTATTPPSTDEDLIVGLWQRQTSAWTAGFDAGVEFWVDNNYPPMECTFSDYMSSRFPLGPVEGLIVERVADPESIQPDDGWVIPGGSLEGEVAEGRVYVLTVESRRFEAGQPTPEPETLELHVTIIDGVPYFFLGC
jgi:hypothetical protein